MDSGHLKSIRDEIREMAVDLLADRLDDRQSIVTPTPTLQRHLPTAINPRDTDGTFRYK
jgi:hypothetical protein